MKKAAIAITFLLTIQLFYGAFMAGLKVAAAPTYSTINGSWLPYEFRNIFNDRITIHFIHRTLAYLLAIAIGYLWLKAKPINTSAAFNKVQTLLLIFVLLQTTLGVVSVLTSTKIVVGHFGVFEWMAQLHQLVGMLLLLSLLAVIYLLRFNKPSA
jgi:cytochrome c oxidase assembly protein subunit 15